MRKNGRSRPSVYVVFNSHSQLAFTSHITEERMEAEEDAEGAMPPTQSGLQENRAFNRSAFLSPGSQEE